MAPSALERAREAFRAACGSDWCWWYGDDHSSENDLEFDRLFRRHLRAVYEAIGLPAPEDLSETIITTRHLETRQSRPAGEVTPVVDGEITSPDEWEAAGLHRVPLTGAMHRGAQGIRAVRFGADRRCLNLLVEPSTGALRDLVAAAEVVVIFPGPESLRYRVRREDTQARVVREAWTEMGWIAAETRAVAAVGSVLELARRCASSSRGPGSWSSGSWSCRTAPSWNGIRRRAPSSWGWRRSRVADDIESTLKEVRVFPPTSGVVRPGRPHQEPRGISRALRGQPPRPRRLLGRAGRDARTGSRPWDKVLDWNEPFAKWFVGGKINASVQLPRPPPGRPAQEQGGDHLGRRAGRHARRSPTRSCTARCASSPTCSRGSASRRATASRIYMPMVPERRSRCWPAPASARRTRVIFGGFSADAVADRNNDAKAKLVITADGGWRRGKVVPLKANVDAALEKSPTRREVHRLQSLQPAPTCT